MRSQLLKQADIPALLAFVPTIDPDPLALNGTERYLSHYCCYENSCCHAAQSRSVYQGLKLVGHFSAHLISNDKANFVIGSRDKDSLYNLDLTKCLNDNELKRANAGLGCTLLVTTFFWQHKSILADIAFMNFALDHITRWFEGNRIDHVVFSVDRKFWNLIDGFFKPLEPSCKQVVPLSDNFSIVRISAPWRPTGVSPNWAKRLLSPKCKCPQRALDEVHKLRSRILHEFDFDLEAAISAGCIPSWTYNQIDRKQLKRQDQNCTAFGKWRTSVASSLGLEKGAKYLKDEIRSIFAECPALLCL